MATAATWPALVPTDFWDQARPVLEAIKPVFMLAEWDELYPSGGLTWEEFNSDTHLLERAFDMTFGLRLHYLLDTIAEGKAPLNAIDEYLAAERAKYPPSAYLMHFTSNHDVNSWDGTEYERLGDNAACPSPCSQPCCRACPWCTRARRRPCKSVWHSLTKTPSTGRISRSRISTRSLLQLKRRHPALHNGDAACTLIRIPGPAPVYAFLRSKEAPAILCAINISAETQHLPLSEAAVGTWQDVFSQDQLMFREAETLPIPAHGWRVLEKIGS